MNYTAFPMNYMAFSVIYTAFSMNYMAFSEIYTAFSTNYMAFSEIYMAFSMNYVAFSEIYTAFSTNYMAISKLCVLALGVHRPVRKIHIIYPRVYVANRVVLRKALGNRASFGMHTLGILNYHIVSIK